MTSKVELFEELRNAKINFPNNSTLHDQIRSEIFTFSEVLNAQGIHDILLESGTSELLLESEDSIIQEEYLSDVEVFEYCNLGYVESNPGIINNQWSSYVGNHISDSGEPS